MSIYIGDGLSNNDNGVSDNNGLLLGIQKIALDTTRDRGAHVADSSGLDNLRKGKSSDRGYKRNKEPLGNTEGSSSREYTIHEKDSCTNYIDAADG